MEENIEETSLNQLIVACMLAKKKKLNLFRWDPLGKGQVTNDQRQRNI